MNLLQRPRVIPVLVSVWLALAGCGPQGGGTGTGEMSFALSDFGARTASSCSSTIADALDCGDAQPGTADVTASGTAEVNFVDSSGRDRAWLYLSGNRAELELFCGGARFVGEWGVLADGTQAYFGAWSTERQGRGVRAMLTLRPMPLDTLQIEVTDAASGQILVGGVILQRGTPPAPGC